MASKFVPVLLSSATVAATIYAGYYYIVEIKKNRCPTQWKKVGTVKKLFIFPLKSARYIELQTVECTPVGFKLLRDGNNPLQLRDRSFVVYGGPENEVKNGNGLPSLVKIEVSVHNGEHIALDAPQMRTLYVKVPELTEENRVMISNKHPRNVLEKVEAIDCGDEAAKWISQHLTQKDWSYRLAYHNTNKTSDLISPKTQQSIFYKNISNKIVGPLTNYSSILILSQASMNEFLKSSNDSNITDMYFRPNIIIDDPELQANEEDSWDWIKIGDEIILRNIKEHTKSIFATTTGLKNIHDDAKTSTCNANTGTNKNSIMGLHAEVKNEIGRAHV